MSGQCSIEIEEIRRGLFFIKWIFNDMMENEKKVFKG